MIRDGAIHCIRPQVEQIRNLVDSYMTIVTKHLRDSLPKACMYMLVNSAKEFMRDELLAGIYQSGGTVRARSSSLMSAVIAFVLRLSYGASRQSAKAPWVARPSISRLGCVLLAKLQPARIPD